MDIKQNKASSIFFNQQFDKKRLKALISWVFKQSGEAEALRVIDLLKETGFKHATRAGISIGLHDLTTPREKSWLVSLSQDAISTTERDFVGARITATERSQRIVDTWHRASESLSKQVVDYFESHDRFNPVYIMALSGARGNFSQVRQLIGMRGLMADQQGKIVSFPIRSNLREGLTLTEYFISCSGARKGLVDTALRTADTGYLTRRLVDVAHHVVVKRVRCNSSRAIAFRSLQSYNKCLLPLKERLVGRVLAEDIFISDDFASPLSDKYISKKRNNETLSLLTNRRAKARSLDVIKKDDNATQSRASISTKVLCKRTSPKEDMPSLHLSDSSKTFSSSEKKYPLSTKIEKLVVKSNRKKIAEKDREISLKLSSEIAAIRDRVYLRSPLTCGFTHSVCQLCYGWSISQGSLVSLGDAVGVIAAQSIGEPGTQLTMRTFHTGGVFSGDLLQEIRAPHAGTIHFSQAFQGLLIRTAHGRIAFLSKTEGNLFLTDKPYKASLCKSCKYSSREVSKKMMRYGQSTTISIPSFTMLFVREGERVDSNTLLAEFSIKTKEGNQPIKTQQTIFAELSGRIVEESSGKVYTKQLKESSLLLHTSQKPRYQSLFEKQNRSFKNSIVENSLQKGLQDNTFSNSPMYNSFVEDKRQGSSYRYRSYLNLSLADNRSAVMPMHMIRYLSIKRLCYRRNEALARFCRAKPTNTNLRFIKGQSNAQKKICTARMVSRAVRTLPIFKNLRFVSCAGYKIRRDPLRAKCAESIGEEVMRRTSVRRESRRKRTAWTLLPFRKADLMYIDVVSARQNMQSFINMFIMKNNGHLTTLHEKKLDVNGLHMMRYPLASKFLWNSNSSYLSTIYYCKKKLKLDSKESYLYKRESCLSQRDASIGKSKKVAFVKNFYGDIFKKERKTFSFFREKKRFDQIDIDTTKQGKCRYSTRYAKSTKGGHKKFVNVSFNRKEMPLDSCYNNERTDSLNKNKAIDFLVDNPTPYVKSSIASRSDYNGSIITKNTDNIHFDISESFKKEKRSYQCNAQIFSRNSGEDLENDPFNSIEPIKSGRLGFLKILSTRIGAHLDYTCPVKSFEFSRIKREEIYRLKKNSCNLSKSDRFKKEILSKTALLTSSYLEGHSDSSRKDYSDNLDPTVKNDVLQPCFSSYLHPEDIKENRFFLQTIAEYGDVVDETYKNTTI